MGPMHWRSSNGSNSICFCWISRCPCSTDRNQRVITALLEKRGHSVQTAGNGADALAILEREQFDMLLLDIQMPVLDRSESESDPCVAGKARPLGANCWQWGRCTGDPRTGAIRYAFAGYPDARARQIGIRE